MDRLVDKRGPQLWASWCAGWDGRGLGLGGIRRTPRAFGAMSRFRIYHCQYGVQEDHDQSPPDGGSSVSSRSSDSRCDCRCPVAEGQTTEGILALYPDLEADDVREALLFAAEAVRERALPLAAGE